MKKALSMLLLLCLLLPLAMTNAQAGRASFGFSYQEYRAMLNAVTPDSLIQWSQESENTYIAKEEKSSVALTIKTNAQQNIESLQFSIEDTQRSSDLQQSQAANEAFYEIFLRGTLLIALLEGSADLMNVDEWADLLVELESNVKFDLAYKMIRSPNSASATRSIKYAGYTFEYTISYSHSNLTIQYRILP